ncbi:MAG: hypothetical protein D6798_08480 [Deltaproteobacteria bacterium]|nr:MAG: hypothetical protein D6798_08480 [Deltaproteobacteria bacterium]
MPGVPMSVFSYDALFSEPIGLGSATPWTRKVDPRLLMLHDLGAGGVARLVDTVSATAEPRGAMARRLGMPMAGLADSALATAGPIDPLAAGVRLAGERVLLRTFVRWAESGGRHPELPEGFGYRESVNLPGTSLVEVDLASLPVLAGMPEVAALELARPAAITAEPCTNGAKPGPSSQQSDGPDLSTRQVVMGVVDMRFDLLHPDLAWSVRWSPEHWPQYAAGPGGDVSKVRALFDLSAGAVVARKDIEAELAAWTAQAAQLDSRFQGFQQLEHLPYADDDILDHHGLMCATVAAGTGQSPEQGIVGPARDSDLLLAALDGAGQGMPSTADLVEALAWMSSQPREGERLVVNVSMGTAFGPHDGTSLDVACIDELSKRTGMVVVVAAGNENQLGRHVRTEGRGEAVTTLTWTVQAHDPVNGYARVAPTSPDGVQVWGSHGVPLKAFLRPPGMDPGDPPLTLAIDHRGQVDIVHQHRVIGTLYWDNRSRWAPTGDARIEIWWVPRPGFELPLGDWTLAVVPLADREQVVNIDAWLGVNDAANITWTNPSPLVDEATLSDLATGFLPVVVGNAHTWRLGDDDPQSPHDRGDGLHLNTTSGCGPTRDGRNGVDFSARGTAVRLPAARHRKGGDQPPVELYRYGTGTSVSAPRVAGVVAQLLAADDSIAPGDVAHRLAEVRGLNHATDTGFGRGFIE